MASTFISEYENVANSSIAYLLNEYYREMVHPSGEPSFLFCITNNDTQAKTTTGKDDKPRGKRANELAHC